MNITTSSPFYKSGSLIKPKTTNIPIVPKVSDQTSLGTGTLMFSDIFLASGGVINFNNSDVTVTHSANTLAFAGASSGYTFDAPVTFSDRTLGFQGVDVASANDITLTKGNYFDITGAVEMQRILGTGWTAGTTIILQFDGAPLVKHNTAAGAGYFGIKLASSTDFAATADDVLMLVFDGAWWREISRTTI